MAAIDASGSVAAGASTNGAIFKVPGRVGDGAVPGGGAYADSAVGACGATGDGDVHLRFLPCYQVVEHMRQGMGPLEAAEAAVARIAKRVPTYVGAVFAVDRHGAHGAACHGWTFAYAFRDASSEGTQVVQVQPLRV
jgi:N4-(beta-N-acetylglucosaminyl)-L-asparaginase